jgi:hypothetical protein
MLKYKEENYELADGKGSKDINVILRNILIQMTLLFKIRQECL